MKHSAIYRFLSCAQPICLILSPSVSFAMQPLADFLEHARSRNPANKEALALALQLSEEEQAAAWKLLPSIAAQGNYTRNEYENILKLPGPKDLTLTPYNQLDSAIGVSIPLIDVAAWERKAGAEAMTQAAQAGQAATEDSIEKQVIRSYYQVLGTAALLQSAEKNLEFSQSNNANVQQRNKQGTASELDLQRTNADVARVQQELANAQLSLITARRQLESLSGLKPDEVTDFPADDLQEEKPLDDWFAGASSLPAVKAASASRIAAEKAISTSNSNWLPTLTGLAQQRYTNATGFSGGRQSYYLLQLSASWRIDGTLTHNTEAMTQSAAAARAREEGALTSAKDELYSLWQHVHIGIRKSHAAIKLAAAASRSADLAKQQYAAGVATQLDLLQALQEAFRAEVSRIQVDSDLQYSRAALRLCTNKITPNGLPKERSE